MIRRVRVAGVAAAVSAASAARSGAALLTRHPPGGEQRWGRTNHRGEPISLLEGPAYVAGAVQGVLLARGTPARVRAAAALAALTAGGLGAYDDLAEGSVRKGLAGHLGALARGELTTGAVKVLGLAGSGLLAAALALPAESGPTRRGRLFDVLTGGAVVAGSANLVNLLDLRPGRALKVVLALGTPIALSGSPAAGPAGAAAGAAAALLPQDLSERSMLGDTGANAAGALLGVAAVAGAGRRGRLAILAVLVGLTLASERVSFTQVIASTPGLRELDALGRRPAET